MEPRSAGAVSLEGQSPVRTMIIEEASVRSINRWLGVMVEASLNIEDLFC